jgi:hypothetical protein
MNGSRVALLLGCVALVGCELVAGIADLSLSDGGSGGTQEAGNDSPAGDSPGDDSPVEHESSTVDSSSDAPGNPTRDSGLDAGEGGSSCGTPGGFFCASLCQTPLFCADFDEHPSIPGVFGTSNTMGGTLTLDKTAFVSSPNSLSAQDNALSSGTLDTNLRSVFPVATTATITFDFQFQPAVVDPSSTADVVVASLDFTDTPGNRYTLQFTLVQEGTSLGMRFEEQAGGLDGSMFYAMHPLPDSLTVGSWTSIALTVDRTGPMTASAHVSFGSTDEIDLSALNMTVNATSLQLTIGSAYESEPSMGWTSLYDNVVLDIQ